MARCRLACNSYTRQAARHSSRLGSFVLGNRASQHLLSPEGSEETVTGALATPERPRGGMTGAAIGGIAGAIGGIVAGLALSGLIGPALAVLAGIGIAAAATGLGYLLGSLIGASAMKNRNEKIVRVMPKIPAPVYDNTRSSEEIAGISRGWDVASHSGFTSAKLKGSVQSTTGLEPTRQKDGKFPYWLHELALPYGFDEIRVWIASEYAPGSCEYQATLDHENEHVEADRRIVTDYGPRLRDAVISYAPLPTKEEPLWVSSEEEGDAAVDVLVRAIAKNAAEPVYDEMRRKLHEANQDLDSAANYQAVHDKCSAW
jgi:hypothetical protein